MAKAKPFDIPKRETWEAFKKVKANQEAAGVDGQTTAEFEVDLSNNLYRLWNRMSSGTTLLRQCDIQSYFDSIDWELLLKAVRHHTDWVLLCVESS